MPDIHVSFLKPEALLSQIGLRPGMRVADLGCGSGYMSFVAARIVGERGVVYAIDVQKTVLEQVKREARAENMMNIQTVWADLEIPGATQIPSQSLDAVFLVNVLYQAKDKKALFAEARRLLKLGGVCLVVDWKPGDVSIGPPAEKRLTLESINNTATTSGFVGQGAVEAGAFHNALIYKI